MVVANMISFVTALHHEARPIIEHFSLKKDMESHGLDVFRNEDFSLVVTGIGKLKSAVATTRLLSAYGRPKLLVNIGICGAPKSFPIGSPYLINKITDVASSRCFFPDLIIKHSLEEAQLATYDMVVSKHGDNSELVDMEGSGFFEAAASFLSADQILCIKVVSDHLDGKKLLGDEITNLIEKNISKLSIFIAALSEYKPDSRKPLTSEEKECLATIAENLRLSHQQRRILTESATTYKLKREGSLSILEGYLNARSKTNMERRKHLREITALLS